MEGGRENRAEKKERGHVWVLRALAAPFRQAAVCSLVQASTFEATFLDLDAFRDRAAAGVSVCELASL